jgi:succinate-semialdehyde dehydrogenase/glutarate-semialdehyde dehydrogenase
MRKAALQLRTEKEKYARLISLEMEKVILNALNPYVPFGELKKFGYGRELSRKGILQFVNSNTVYLGRPFRY